MMENILRMYAGCLEGDSLGFLMDIVEVKN